MFEFHGWFALAESPEEADAGSLHEGVEEVRSRLDQLRWPTAEAEIKLLNGEYFLVVHGLVNRLRHEHADLERLIDFVAIRLPGSYGLLWRRSDEQSVPPGAGAFDVVVLARGAVQRRLDPFLSPTNPTIEDGPEGGGVGGGAG